MKTSDKIRAWSRVMFHLIIVDIILKALGYFLVIPAMLLRWMGKLNPLWIFLEDRYIDGEVGIPAERSKCKLKFVREYLEQANRNSCDHLQVLMAFKGDAVRSDYYYVRDNGTGAMMLRPKWYTTEDSLADCQNKGIYYSEVCSLLGDTYVYFKQDGKWLMLYSKAWIEKGNPLWVRLYKLFHKNVPERIFIRELNIGAASRILFRSKFGTAIRK